MSYVTPIKFSYSRLQSYLANAEITINDDGSTLSTIQNDIYSIEQCVNQIYDYDEKWIKLILNFKDETRQKAQQEIYNKTAFGPTGYFSLIADAFDILPRLKENDAKKSQSPSLSSCPVYELYSSFCPDESTTNESSSSPAITQNESSVSESSPFNFIKENEIHVQEKTPVQESGDEFDRLYDIVFKSKVKSEPSNELESLEKNLIQTDKFTKASTTFTSSTENLNFDQNSFYVNVCQDYKQEENQCIFALTTNVIASKENAEEAQNDESHGLAVNEDYCTPRSILFEQTTNDNVDIFTGIKKSPCHTYVLEEQFECKMSTKTAVVKRLSNSESPSSNGYYDSIQPNNAYKSNVEITTVETIVSQTNDASLIINDDYLPNLDDPPDLIDQCDLITTNNADASDPEIAKDEKTTSEKINDAEIFTCSSNINSVKNDDYLPNPDDPPDKLKQTSGISDHFTASKPASANVKIDSNDPTTETLMNIQQFVQEDNSPELLILIENCLKNKHSSKVMMKDVRWIKNRYDTFWQPTVDPMVTDILSSSTRKLFIFMYSKKEQNFDHPVVGWSCTYHSSPHSNLLLFNDFLLFIILLFHTYLWMLNCCITQIQNVPVLSPFTPNRLSLLLIIPTIIIYYI